MSGHKAISSKQLLELAAKVAADKRDTAALDRLAKVCEATKNSANLDQVTAAKKLASASCKVDPAMSVSATETSPDQLALYQEAINGVKAAGIVGAEKSNEIPAVQQLIDMLDLSGAVVTADAMHCQRETAEKIIAKEADFVLMVKGNQETLQAAVQSAMVQAFEEEDSKLRRCQVSEKNRDRQETREVAAIPVPKDRRCSAAGPA
ncbi:Transposase DDE domain protein [Anatilimnocola aggregata]|uniref:Transposase DDE domain protein n=1 Tax=Anatilimnocola aggregata TaxID=2528021 RepID=A0A517Y916_9BACT|nr:Transposase DDE domain protein [Anatilimnocola aggregata]